MFVDQVRPSMVTTGSCGPDAVREHGEGTAPGGPVARVCMPMPWGVCCGWFR